MRPLFPLLGTVAPDPSARIGHQTYVPRSEMVHHVTLMLAFLWLSKVNLGFARLICHRTASFLQVPVSGWLTGNPSQIQYQYFLWSP